jgi:hypothetical protein
MGQGEHRARQLRRQSWGKLLTGLVTGDVNLKGDAGIASALAWTASVMLVAGVGLISSAVYPYTKGAEPGRARRFAEIVQFEDGARAGRGGAGRPGRRGTGRRRMHNADELRCIHPYAWRRSEDMARTC